MNSGSSEAAQAIGALCFLRLLLGFAKQLRIQQNQQQQLSTTTPIGIVTIKTMLMSNDLKKLSTSLVNPSVNGVLSPVDCGC